jgi:K+-transporting ATPase KdpF subunit
MNLIEGASVLVMVFGFGYLLWALLRAEDL